MNTLRKRPTFNEMYNLNQPTFKFPDRKGVRAINDHMISNLLFDDEVVDDIILQQKKQRMNMTSVQKDQSTQTILRDQLRDQFTQTIRLDYGTQTDFKPDENEEGYRRNPHFYKVHPAFSKEPMDYDYFKSRLFRRKDKNNAYSETFETENSNLMDTGFQTSTYIPGSLTKKRNNINQTVRYEVRRASPPSTPPPSDGDQPSEPPSEDDRPSPNTPEPPWKKKLPPTPSPLPTPEPSPVPSKKTTPVSTPPRSEQEEEYDEEGLDEMDIYLNRYGYMAWFGRYIANNGHEQQPQEEEPQAEEEEPQPQEEEPQAEEEEPQAEEELPQLDEEQLIAVAGVLQLPLPFDQTFTDPYTEYTLDEEELEQFWYDSKNKQKRKKK